SVGHPNILSATPERRQYTPLDVSIMPSLIPVGENCALQERLYAHGKGSIRRTTMQNVEITRHGDLSVGDHLAAMRSWQDHEGAQAINLRAVRILGCRITFSAVFVQADGGE